MAAAHRMGWAAGTRLNSDLLELAVTELSPKQVVLVLAGLMGTPALAAHRLQAGTMPVCPKCQAASGHACETRTSQVSGPGDTPTGRQAEPRRRPVVKDLGKLWCRSGTGWLCRGEAHRCTKTSRLATRWRS
jgi:hypothetical protein